ncbi:MAG: GNAT family N-acetyltransferase [Actinobacteria bacterium]|nr:GNAT family N-acetyltransferase [Actinomycetota bacterium]
MTFRAPLAGDAAAVAELMNVYDIAHGGQPEMDAAEVHGDWSYPEFDRGRDAWLVESEAGRVLAYGWVARRSAGQYLVDAYFDPERRDRAVATELFERLEKRARELGATLFVTGILGADEWGGELLRDLGYAYTRSQFQMAIDLDGPPPPPELPDGVELRMFLESDERAYHETMTEAFAEEWGFEPEPFEDWRARLVERETFDAGFWFLAVADGVPVGALVAFPSGPGGWIQGIGVRPQWRRRGLGLALLRRSFASFWDAGRTHVALSVDEANPTGAGRLYRAAGMRETQRVDRYDKKPSTS